MRLPIRNLARWIAPCILLLPHSLHCQSSLADLKTQFLNHEYANVLLPLVDLKSSNQGKRNFELDYMIGVSLCLTDGNLKSGQEYFVAMSREYPMYSRRFDNEPVDLAQVAAGLCKMNLMRASATPAKSEVDGKADTPTGSTPKSSDRIARDVKTKEDVKSNRNAQRAP